MSGIDNFLIIIFDIFILLTNNDRFSFMSIKIFNILSNGGKMYVIKVNGNKTNDTYGTKKRLYTTDKVFIW